MDALAGSLASRPGARRRRESRLRGRLALAALVLVGLALGTAALRIDLLRARYGLAQALQEERDLLEQRREALAQRLTLRDPGRLARLAREHGLERPARIIDVPRRGGRRP